MGTYVPFWLGLDRLALRLYPIISKTDWHVFLTLTMFYNIGVHWLAFCRMYAFRPTNSLDYVGLCCFGLFSFVPFLFVTYTCGYVFKFLYGNSDLR